MHLQYLPLTVIASNVLICMSSLFSSTCISIILLMLVSHCFKYYMQYLLQWKEWYLQVHLFCSKFVISSLLYFHIYFKIVFLSYFTDLEADTWHLTLSARGIKISLQMLPWYMGFWLLLWRHWLGAMNHYQFNVLLQSGRYKLNQQLTGTGSIITTE